MWARHLAGPVIASLSQHDSKSFADEATWTAHLKRLGLTDLKTTPDPVRIATEGALWPEFSVVRKRVGKGVLIEGVIGGAEWRVATG